ncbi:MAG: hypothetical protein ACJ72Z_14370 [Pyrinomonadaceae bacterium]
MRYFILSLVAAVVFCVSITGQVRPVGDGERPADPGNAPGAFEAKYEGVIFGYNEKEKGTLKFDDDGARLIFYGKDGKEKFSLPYDAMMAVYPSAESVTSTAGNVVKYIPLPGAGLGALIKEKRRYMVIQFQDADLGSNGTVNFRIEDKAVLQAVIPALGKKAQMSPRGEAYYRPHR